MFGAVVARALLGAGVEIHVIERCPDVLSSWNDARGHHLHRRVLVGHQTAAHAKHRHRAFVGCDLWLCVQRAHAPQSRNGKGCKAMPRSAHPQRWRLAASGTAQIAWDTSERLSIGRRWNTLYFPIN